MAYPTDPTTLLSIAGINLPPYSSRGITQNLTPIGAAFSALRDVNGTLVNLSLSQFQKYASEIVCRDMQAPAFDGVWPGDTVVVDCVAELSYLTSGGSPTRPVVSGSSRVEGSYTFYRPQLTMMVMGFSIDRDEWGAAIGWTLSLEEV